MVRFPFLCGLRIFGFVKSFIIVVTFAIITKLQLTLSDYDRLC